MARASCGALFSARRRRGDEANVGQPSLSRPRGLYKAGRPPGRAPFTLPPHTQPSANPQSLTMALSLSRSMAGPRVGAMRASAPLRSVKMAYKVTLKTPSGEQVIECPADTYILDAAEEAGIVSSG